MTYLLGLDIGTTNCKAVLINENGEVKAFLSSGEYQIIRPQPDWAEEDPRDWWEATKKVIKQLVSSSGIKPDDIEAIGVSSTEEGVVPVDKNGEPLYNCMIWQDSRNKEQEAW
ncbi:MAG: FGGY-family carbohydrate kinase, partial [Candidatus Freyarchaeota archaeon]